ncbi:MAG TPA: glycoside hydrolase family 88 protein [Steroidobacteraceae bacterium]
MLQRWGLMALAAMTSLPVQLATADTSLAPASSSHARILAIGAKVADWQLAHLGNFDYIPENQFRRDTAAPRDWVQAAFYIGLAAFADTAQNVRYRNVILAHGEQEAWGFDERPRHADADAIGAVWVWAAKRTHDSAKLAPIKARFDAVLASPATVSLEFGNQEASCQDRWCWSDALFMAPPAWVALAEASGDERYLAHADQEFWATTRYLYDARDHLFFRDSRYFTQRDAAGRKIFWSRGNGWVFAGLARILDELPQHHPSRARYETLFKQMAARSISLQGPEGYWPVSLLEPQKTPETSGTGFFVYGLAWGINHGLLPCAGYRKAADRGWRALISAVSADGKLGWVQPIGAAPDRVDPDDTQLYGVGAFLLAASEMATLP